jgi:serine/threonine-protein kinase
MPEDFEFPELSDIDNITELIEQLKQGLLYYPDDDFNEEFVRIRNILKSHPLLKANLPDFLRHCRDVGDYRAFMEAKYEESYEWDTHLRQSMLAVLESLEEAEIVFEAFEIIENIGRGGFGQVFKVRHRLLGRNFAIKVFQPSFQEGGNHLARFFQEASMLYELDHPNIVKIRDVGLYQQRPFILMDHFDGMNLNTALMRGGRMPPNKAVRMIQQVCSAMQHAHRKQIIHRDLKPSNILLAHPQQCRVIDFGLGVYVEIELESRLTKTGETIGGDHFTARELLANPKLLDPRSDIYSIGAIWYHSLTNEVPSGSDVAKSLDSIENLSDKHKAIILQCLADADDRYSSCSALLHAIDKSEEPNGASL